MSSSPELLNRLRKSNDEGFSLVEILVAMSIFAVIAFAMLPLMLTSLRATVRVKLETEAKNLSQLQVERMRGLQFHVDRQNGPFIDLLDVYYSNVSTTIQTRSDGTTGQWVADANATVPGAPDGPAYVVTDASIDGVPGFSQRIFTQFLRTTATRAVVPSTYDSLLVGQDSPPAQLVSVTVLTDWNRSGRTGSLRTYTEIADESSSVAFITSQAQALALRVTSTSATGTTLIGQAGQAKADGSLTTGSVAGVQGEAASAEVLGGTRVVGALADASAPGSGSTPNVQGVASVSADAVRTDTVGCGWASFGKTRVLNATATTAAGYPVVPFDGPTDVMASGASRTRAGLLTSGGGCDVGSNRYAFTWRNSVDQASYPAALGVLSNEPLVSLLDVNGSGDLTTSPAVGSVAVAATGLLDVPRSVSARASATTTGVRVMPTAGFPNGLVTATLTESSITCKSGAPATASYSLKLSYPGTVDRVFTLSTASTLPNPSSITWTEGGSVRNLGQYLSWTLASSVKEGSNGIRSLGPVFTLSGKADAVGQDFSLSLGTLSCVADDNR